MNFVKSVVQICSLYWELLKFKVFIQLSSVNESHHVE